MPKVPQPTKTPASISPALWQNDNREEILTFLGDRQGQRGESRHDNQPAEGAVLRASRLHAPSKRSQQESMATTTSRRGFTSRIKALEDACDTIEQKCGHDSRWGFEICTWRLKSQRHAATRSARRAKA